MSTKCLVTKLKESVNNPSLKKMGELRLKSVNDGNLTVRPYYGDIVVSVLSGSATYNGSPVTEPIELVQNTTTDSVFTVTNGSVISIENKYGLDTIIAPNMELTDGDTLESLNPLTIYKLELGGDTKGSISGFGITRLNTLHLDGTKASGSIDIFAESTQISSIRIRNTQVGGNLSSLVGKNLSPTCHFNGSNLRVDLADVANMSTGNTDISKYNSCYIYGDVSSLPASSYIIYAQTADKVLDFTWLTQRHNVSGACIIGNTYLGGTMFMNYNTYLDAMLIDQAQCEVSSSASASTKKMNVYGAHTENSGWESAVATLKSKGYTVVINDVTQ